MSTILLAEDEENIAGSLILNFELAGYKVIHAPDGSAALKLFNENRNKLDLVLLDVMMPVMDGFEVFDEIRRTDERIPVIFLTARDQSADKIRGLRSGASDYITKPFDLEELLLRVANAIKKHRPVRNEFVFGRCSINFETYEVTDIAGHVLPLSKREIGLLAMLTAEPNKVISRDDIIENLWGTDENASSRTIDNFILGFRKLFEKDPKTPQHFISVRGVGYKFVN